MKIKSLVIPNRYHDSVSLMLLSREAASMEGVQNVSVVMGTPNNIEQLRDSGLLTPESEKACPNDLIIAFSVDDETDENSIAEAVMEALNRPSSSSGVGDMSDQFWSQRGAVRTFSDARIALISVPGIYAAYEAEKALDSNMNVMLFSDNVSIEDEKHLKQKAESKGLLLMGPDCGTAIIGGVPLAFANIVPEGPVGIVGASGTGIQELTVQLARRGMGISHAIGTGGRDLSETIGGITARSGIKLLASDPETRVICLISKPPAESVAKELIAELKATGKPFIVHFLGTSSDFGLSPENMGDSLTDTAERIVSMINGDTSQRKYLRGLFCGGTLADEAQRTVMSHLTDLYSNIPIKGVQELENPDVSMKNSIVDLGEDYFTRGKAHPMIDPSTRTARIESEASDPETAVVLFDVVLGRGSHPSPAEPVVEVITRIKENNPENAPAFVGYVCGTAEDPQGLALQEEMLRKAGAIVADSNIEAAIIAASIASSKLSRSNNTVTEKAALLNNYGKESSNQSDKSLEKVLNVEMLKEPKIINIGLKSFSDDIRDSGTKCAHVNWSPPGWGDLELAGTARRLMEE